MRKMVIEFWKKWSSSYYQSLVKYHRWRLRERNAEPGDVILVLDKEGQKGKFTLGIIASVKKDSDDIVRKVTIKYKLAQPKDKVEYQTMPYKYAERNVRGLALVVTAQERKDIEEVDLDEIRFKKRNDVSDTEESNSEDEPIGSENQTRSAEEFFDDEQTNDNKEDQVEAIEEDLEIDENVKKKSDSKPDERNLPATSTGRKRWKPRKLDM